MPGDPEKCREQASECMRLAMEARCERSKSFFQDLAETWSKLAAELQDAQNLLGALSRMDFENAKDEDFRQEVPTSTRNKADAELP